MSEADNRSLRRLGVELSAREYLREIWARREFAIVVPANDIRAQNMDTVLGQIWHILNPAALVAVYWLVFDVLLSTNRGIENYLGFLVVGVLVFQLTQRVVQDAAACVPRNEGLIRSIQFPRALLPISSLTGQTYAFLPALGVMLLTLCATGSWPTWRWIMILPILFAQSLVNLGAGLIAARLGSTVRDLQQVLPHLFRVLFYVSGVLFAVDRVVSNETIVRLWAFNPLYAMVAAARWSLMGLEAGLEVWVSLVVWAAVLPAIGLRMFRSREHRYGA